jgi:hypothetical protein
MEAVSSSEISVNISHAALCNIPDDSHLHCKITFGALAKSKSAIGMFSAIRKNKMVLLVIQATASILIYWTYNQI